MRELLLAERRRALVSRWDQEAHISDLPDAILVVYLDANPFRSLWVTVIRTDSRRSCYGIWFDCGSFDIWTQDVGEWRVVKTLSPGRVLWESLNRPSRP